MRAEAIFINLTRRLFLSPARAIMVNHHNSGRA
jgi:hypothetical protein